MALWALLAQLLALAGAVRPDLAMVLKRDSRTACLGIFKGQWSNDEWLVHCRGLAISDDICTNMVECLSKDLPTTSSDTLENMLENMEGRIENQTIICKDWVTGFISRTKEYIDDKQVAVWSTTIFSTMRKAVDDLQQTVILENTPDGRALSLATDSYGGTVPSNIWSDCLLPSFRILSRAYAIVLNKLLKRRTQAEYDENRIGKLRAYLDTLLESHTGNAFKFAATGATEVVPPRVQEEAKQQIAENLDKGIPAEPEKFNNLTDEEKFKTVQALWAMQSELEPPHVTVLLSSLREGSCLLTDEIPNLLKAGFELRVRLHTSPLKSSAKISAIPPEELQDPDKRASIKLYHSFNGTMFVPFKEFRIPGDTPPADGARLLRGFVLNNTLDEWDSSLKEAAVAPKVVIVGRDWYCPRNPHGPIFHGKPYLKIEDHQMVFYNPDHNKAPVQPEAQPAGVFLNIEMEQVHSWFTLMEVALRLAGSRLGAWGVKRLGGCFSFGATRTAARVDPAAGDDKKNRVFPALTRAS